MAVVTVKRRWAVRLVRRLWHLAVALLVLVAVYQTGGRLLMPHLGGQKTGIELQLSQLLGATVTIGELRGGWFRLSPTFELTDVVISAGNVRHGARQMTLELDSVDSVLQARPAVARIHANGLNLVLQEDAAGRWSLAGLARGTGPDYSEQILDFILQARGIDLAEAALRLQRADGRVVTVASLYLDLRNRGATHELQGQFRINGQQGPSQVHVHLEGDPRDTFVANVYAGTSGLDVGALLDVREAQGWQLQGLTIGGGLWLDADENGIQMLRASLTDVAAAATHGATQRAATLEHAAFNAYARPGAAAWEVGVADMGFDLQQTPWRIPSLQLQLPHNDADTLTLRAGAIELGLLRELAVLVPEVSAEVAGIIDTLNPRGLLRNVRFEAAPDGSTPGGFALQSNVQDLAVDAWSGAPAGRGLHGYLQMDARNGFMEVDSDDAEIHLPNLFTEAWHYDRLNTRVHWTVGDGEFRVGSTAIDVRTDEAGRGLDGSVRFDLARARDAAGAPTSELTLQVGVRSMDVALRSAYLPTLPRIKPTMDWLQAALQGGRVHDSGFLLRTSTLPDRPAAMNTFATWYHVEDGELQFLPDWPALQDITGDVIVRDGDVVVQTQEASIAGMALDPALGRVMAQPGGGSLLTVRGTANTDTGSGLAFLRDSPVRNAIGPIIDTWQAAGQIGVDIALDIPLGANAAQRQDEHVIDVKVQSTGSELGLTDYALAISDINGLVRYHSATGLAATALSARMFDFPIVVGIETLGELAAGRRTRVTSTGRAAVDALQAWQRQPQFVRSLLGYTLGEIDYSATLDILHRPGADGIRTRLQLASDLLGLSSSLPRPFGKTAEESDSLDLELTFLADGQILAARYDDFLSGRIVLDADGIDHGQLFFGDRNRDFNIRQSDEDTPGLLLSGELPYFNYEEWREVTDAMASQATASQRPLAEYLRLVDMQFGMLEVAGQQLRDIAVQVQVDAAGWQIDGTNALVGGHFTIPMDASPWNVTLDYLRFPPRAEIELDAAGEPIEPEKVDVLEAVDPSTLPPFDFVTTELSIGDQNLGTFDFYFRPDGSGATIADFRMQAADSSISDVTLTGGANIDWRYRNGVHTSSFIGVFSAVDLAQVLPRWGHGANVESEQASFSGNLQWIGSPLAFTLRDTSGALQLDIRDGRFVDIDAGTARVFGALNFDALVRRLQLDFSDIFQSGYNFDSITGNLTLERGVVTTVGAVVIDGPASHISINGEIDLAQETIAADMEVQIPLGQNVSMLAGLLGAWPIAVSTYLASIIFAEKVADFATVIYRLDGPWENPTAGFEAPADAAAQEP